MPSACTKPEKKASVEAETPIKQCLTVVEKKVRNLEKRKGKLDLIREKVAAGSTLNSDQKEAVGKYDCVVQTLEFARELQKQFCAIQVEVEKLQKKQLKRESHERQQVEIRRIKELLSLQALLDNMGADEVRADFVGGNKGAVKLTEEELDKLDELYKLISPTRDEENDYGEQLLTASEHIVNYLDAREKEVIGTTYKNLKSIVEKINECGYFDAKEEEEVAESEEVEGGQEAESAATETELDSPAAAAAEVAVEEQSAVVAEQEQAYDATAEQTDFSSVQQLQTTESLQNTLADYTSDAAAGDMLGQQAPPVTYDDDDTAEVTDSTPEADTFFSTQPFLQPRPFNEIVSSVQGNFDFLQESEIEQGKAAAADGSGIVTHVSSQQTADLSSYLSDSAAASSPAQTPFQQESGLDEYGGSSVVSAPPQQAAVSSNAVSQSSGAAAAASVPAFTSEADLYSTQPAVSLSHLTQQAVSSQGAAAGFESNVVDGGPAPIPMPPGQQYQASAASAAEPDHSAATANQQMHATGASNRQFAMNPNADIFTLPTYNAASAEQQQQQQQQQQGSGGSSGYQGAGAAGASDSSSSSRQAWGSTDFSSQAAAAAGQVQQQQQQGAYGGSYGRQQQQQRGANPQQAPGGYRGNQQQRNGNMNGYRGNNPRSAPGGPRGGGGRGSYNGAPPNRGGGMQQQMRGPAGGQGGAYKGYNSRNDYQAEAATTGYQGYNPAGGAFMQQGSRGGPRNSGMPRNGGRGATNYANQRMPPQQQTPQ